MTRPLNPADFWKKLARYAKSAGLEVVEIALRLFYTLQAPATPRWAKSVILGALAYFILPFDAIPDFIPIVGYTDDLATLTAAVGTVRMYITPEIKQRAHEKLQQWFTRPAASPKSTPANN